MRSQKSDRFTVRSQTLNMVTVQVYINQCAMPKIVGLGCQMCGNEDFGLSEWGNCGCRGWQDDRLAEGKL